MTTYEWITTFVGPVCGAIGWFAGRRMRRNDTIHALQTTIDMLNERNRELYEEQVRLRTENTELKAMLANNSKEIDKLKKELESRKK